MTKEEIQASIKSIMFSGSVCGIEIYACLHAGVFADALGGETLLTLIGTRAVHIENYRSILVYTDTEIRIQCRHYILSVSGKKLKICYYDKDEMKISGRLEVIRFE